MSAPTLAEAIESLDTLALACDVSKTAPGSWEILGRHNADKVAAEIRILLRLAREVSAPSEETKLAVAKAYCCGGNCDFEHGCSGPMFGLARAGRVLAALSGMEGK